MSRVWRAGPADRYDQEFYSRFVRIESDDGRVLLLFTEAEEGEDASADEELGREIADWLNTGNDLRPGIEYG